MHRRRIDKAAGPSRTRREQRGGELLIPRLATVPARGQPMFTTISDAPDDGQDVDRQAPPPEREASRRSRPSGPAPSESDQERHRHQQVRRGWPRRSPPRPSARRSAREVDVDPGIAPPPPRPEPGRSGSSARARPVPAAEAGEVVVAGHREDQADGRRVDGQRADRDGEDHVGQETPPSVRRASALTG